ncbi:stress response protein NST1 [Beta vulgaris subsp. vulgaris]|uniref:stress response protein NST1 n=1 Tax=Beta vulgaris subsp. vulgaris TaxID=3555 RepID=UPI0020370448|nr:stress response protein NST1 [Beta vulgaris subsp. vulgaris]
MDIERPHRTTSTPTTTSELFICFTSRLSKSSSMRLSSKSIHSPGRTTVDKSQPLSLSSSLSRRLRHNGSLRGAQSPAMFPSKKTKGSSGFADNPEPSSPKVTCIGQVRVKTKKQGKKMKMRACRSSKRLSGGSGGEASFRRIELTQQQQHQHQHQQQQPIQDRNNNNQRWVHLPLTICEALRAFGSEFSCLFPCKSSCFSSGLCGGEKGGKMEERENGGSSSSSSCAVFRWLVSLQEGEGEGKRRDIELVVGGEENEDKVRGDRMMMERECSRRRSIFDDMEFDDLFGNNNVKNESEMMNNNDENEDDDEESGGRVNIVVPPKNALLLMRCRSDPMKMASLSRKLWDPVLPQDDDEEVEVEEEREKYVKLEEEIKLEEKTEEVIEKEEITEEREKLDEMLHDLVVLESHSEDLPDFSGEEEEIQVEEEQKMEEEDEKLEEEEQETEEKQSIENPEEQQCEIITEEETQLLIEDEIQRDGCLIETTITAKENVEFSENEQDLEQNEEEMKEEEEREMLEFNSILQEEEERENVGQESSDISTSSTSSSLNSSEESTAESKPEEKNPVEVEQEQEEEEARKSMEEEEKEERENKKPTLPDCLLLMMCEPKVSMEVSKETWVCSTDFIRWLPERHHNKRVNKTDGPDDSTTKKKPAPVVPPQPVKQRFEPAPVQPGRSSISFPAGGGSVANLIEQKLVKGGGGGGGGYEPFSLTRCKSAPLRSSAKVAAPEMACSLWGRENGRKLEPHRPATFGVGAAGVGF